MNELKVKSLSFGYQHALSCDVSFSLHEGETLTIIGPNGVGKSTLLKTLAGQIKPLYGRVIYRAKDEELNLHLSDPFVRARHITMMAQVSAIDPGLWVEEVIEMGRTPYLGRFGYFKAEDYQAVEEAIASCELKDLRKRPIAELSGGELQRVRVALALAQQTKIICFDEPVNHLDLKHKAEFFEMVRRLKEEQGLLIIYVLHDLADAFIESDRILVLGNDSARELEPHDDNAQAYLARIFDVDEKRLLNLF